MKMKQILTTMLIAIPMASAAPVFADDFAVVGGKVPPAIEIFYDQILTDPTGGGQNLDLIRKALSDDWQTRPNPLNPVEGTGPKPEGVKQILGIWGTLFTDLVIERQRTIVNGNEVTVLSRFAATINPELPDTMTELPMFPGIPVEQIKGKSFDTMALDIQVLDKEGRIHRTWHMEDWSSAQAQLLGKVPSFEFGFNPSYLD